MNKSIRIRINPNTVTEFLSLHTDINLAKAIHDSIIYFIRDEFYKFNPSFEISETANPKRDYVDVAFDITDLTAIESIVNSNQPAKLINNIFAAAILQHNTERLVRNGCFRSNASIKMSDINIDAMISMVETNGEYQTTIKAILNGHNQKKRTSAFVDNIYNKLSNHGKKITYLNNNELSSEEFKTIDANTDIKIVKA